jgi:hypothetical protein
MKKLLTLMCIGLFAVFCAGCISNDAGRDVTETQSTVSTQGKEMPANATENRIPPSGGMNSTPGAVEQGSMPPAFPGNSTDGRFMPPEGMNKTPGSMGPGTIPQGQGPPDRPDMDQTGVPQQGTTGA